MHGKGKPAYSPLIAVGLGLIILGLLPIPSGNADIPPTDSTRSETAEPLRSGVKVFIVPIHSEIGTQTAYYVKRSIEEARRDKAQYFILDINTPGGLSSAMEEIGKDIAAIEDMTTVAFINTDAASAGAYISIACDKIVMATGSQIGSAALIFISPDGGIMEVSDETREKMFSHARALFRSMAKRKGRSPDLAEAMVDQKIWIQWLVIRGSDGAAEKIIATKENAEKILDKAAKEEKTIEVREDVVTDTQLVNLDYEQAVKYGLADASVEDRDGLFRYLGLDNPVIIKVEPNFSEDFFGFLTNPFLRMILFMVGMAGIYMELKTPGFGVPGILGISAIGLIILISFVIGTANLWEVLLVFAGVILLAVEIFVIPGFGITGIAGLACIFFGMILSLVPFTIPETDWAWDVLFEAVRDVVFGLAGSLVVMALLIRFLPRAPVFRRLELVTSASAEEGFVVPSEEMKLLLGRKGVAVTSLRPSGKADFGDSRFQVVAEGEFLDSGDEVEVIDVTGNAVTVRKVEKND